MAGMLGIEPRSTVLETAILAVVLHPYMSLHYFTIKTSQKGKNMVK